MPQLFLNGWSRLSPIMNKALSVLPQQTAQRYQNFVGAADKLASLGQPAVQLGLLQLSPRRAQRNGAHGRAERGRRPDCL